MNWQFFDKYLEKNENFGECISNHKNKILVYKENVEGTNFYIKKYIPYGKRKIRMAFGIYDDRAIHYEKVVKYLEKLGLPCVKLEYKKIKKITFFDRISIIVTKDCGVTFENFVNDFEKNKELIIKFYDFFILLIKNKIYPIDYNTGGMLIDNKGILRLTDFDDYKINSFLTTSLKRRLIRNLSRIYLEEIRTKECEEFLKSQIKRVVKELNWKV